MTIYPPGVVLAIVMLITMIELLRKRRLSEKYAALWLGLSVITLVVAAVPGLLDHLSSWLGIALPSNLLFFLASVALVAVCVHLACEASSLEEESRRLAEEVAVLRWQVDQLIEGRRGDTQPQSTLQL